MTTSPFDSDRGPERPRRRRRPRFGGDPHAVVPPARFASYYGRPIVKPAPWKHEIPAYFFLGGVAAGSGLIGALADAYGLPALRRNSRFAALAAVGLSSVALIADLGRPERFLNMMRTVKLTSPMSVGTWILAAFGASAGLAAAVEAAGLPGWVDGGGDRRIDRFAAYAGSAGSIGSAAFSAPLAAYTAVLLADTATPLWHEGYRELPFVFTASALAASSGLAMATTPADQTAAVRRLATLGAAAETVAFHVLTHRLGRLARPLREGRPGRLARLASALTVAGGLGAAVAGRRRGGAILSGVAFLAGSAAIRFAVVEAGIASATDPAYTVEPQRARAEQRSPRPDPTGSADDHQRTAGGVPGDELADHRRARNLTGEQEPT